jgi:hypothetical protein
LSVFAPSPSLQAPDGSRERYAVRCRARSPSSAPTAAAKRSTANATAVPAEHRPFRCNIITRLMQAALTQRILTDKDEVLMLGDIL